MVGAGIGGSATAHFLRQHFGPDVQLDVYEKGEVGGRLATVTVNRNRYESGASIIHALNLHMHDFVKQLGERARAIADAPRQPARATLTMPACARPPLRPQG